MLCAVGHLLLGHTSQCGQLLQHRHHIDHLYSTKFVRLGPLSQLHVAMQSRLYHHLSVLPVSNHLALLLSDSRYTFKKCSKHSCSIWWQRLQSSSRLILSLLLLLWSRWCITRSKLPTVCKSLLHLSQHLSSASISTLARTYSPVPEE